jgi:NAD(P)-dependent dehydrogenase (short-subunit alcohol dehydrogenase family)
MSLPSFRAEGAKLILTGRNPERLQGAASEVHALSSSAFDAADPALLQQFFRDLPGSIDHVMVTAGQPHYGRLIDLDFAHARGALGEHLSLFIEVARNAANKVKAGGTLIFMGGTGSRRPGVGFGIMSTVAAALPALTANLALELAPVRVNLIAAGFVDTELSASLLGDELENRVKHFDAIIIGTGQAGPSLARGLRLPAKPSLLSNAINLAAPA